MRVLGSGRVRVLGGEPVVRRVHRGAGGPAQVGEQPAVSAGRAHLVATAVQVQHPVLAGPARHRHGGGHPAEHPAGVARAAGQRAHGAGQVQQAAPQPEREARIEEGSDAEPGEPPSGGR